MKRFLCAATLTAVAMILGGCNGESKAQDDPAPNGSLATAPNPDMRTDDAEPFTVVEVEEEDPWTDVFLPWKWFEDDKQTSRKVAEFETYETVETTAAAEDKDGPLDALKFWEWGKKKDEGPEPITERDVLGNMSPELVTRAETEPETRIRRAKVLDINTRGIWDDLNSILLFERPTRLSEYPSP